MFHVRCFSLAPLPGEVGGTGIELSELRQDRSADFSPLPSVLAGPERGGLKSALLNSMAVGAQPAYLASVRSITPITPFTLSSLENLCWGSRRISSRGVCPTYGTAPGRQSLQRILPRTKQRGPSAVGRVCGRAAPRIHAPARRTARRTLQRSENNFSCSDGVI